MQTDIAVVGGGAVAAATALVAAAHGLRVLHLPPLPALPAAPAPAPTPAHTGGRRYALSRRSVKFLQRLGVQPELLPVHRFVLSAGAGGAAATPLILEDARQPICHMAAEEDLSRAIAAALDSPLAGDVAATPCREVQLQGGAGDDEIQFAADGVAHRAALLAVADGAASPLARQLGITTAVTDFAQQAVVAEVAAPALMADTAYQWFADNDIVALLPAGGNVFSLVWSTAQPPAAEVAAALSQRLSQRIGVEGLTINGEVKMFPLRAQVRAARVAPRAALLGDAAGVVHPLAGQGLNLGLADAETLLQCTHRRLRGDLPLGLAAYSRARSRRHQQLQDITKFFLPRAARAAHAFRIARLPLLRQAAIAFANA